MADPAYITKHISFYNEGYTSTTTAGPSNLDYGGVPLNGDKISALYSGGGYFYVRNDAVLSGCLVNNTPGLFGQLYNVTDGVTVGNEVELTSAAGDGFYISTASLGITTLASGVKWYTLRLRQNCSGDSAIHATVVWVMKIEKQASGTKVPTQVEFGSNFTVTGTTPTASSNQPKRYNGYSAAAFLNGDSSNGEVTTYAVLKATATRTATCHFYSVADAGDVGTLAETSTSYTGSVGTASGMTDGTEMQMKLNSSAAATIGYQKCAGFMIYQVQPSTTQHYILGQKTLLAAIISSTSYIAQDPLVQAYTLAADYGTLSSWIFSSVLLAGASGTTYAQLYDKTSAIASTELSHNTTTITLVNLSISNPLDPTNWFNVYNKRATSNGRSYHWYVQFTETVAGYPVTSAVKDIIGVGFIPFAR